MVRLIKNEFLFYVRLPIIWLSLILMLVMTFIISSAMVSSLYDTAFDTFNIGYFNGLVFDLKVYWVLINILCPFLIIYSFKVELSNAFFVKFNFLPFRFTQKYVAKLSALGIMIFIVGTLHGLFLTSKVIYYSHLSFSELRIHLVLFGWIYFISLVSLFYYHILLFLFFSIRSYWFLVLFHLLNLFLTRFDEYYWIPINWANYAIEYLSHTFTPAYFFRLHPPAFLAFLLVFIFIAPLLILKRLTYAK